MRHYAALLLLVGCAGNSNTPQQDHCIAQCRENANHIHGLLTGIRLIMGTEDSYNRCVADCRGLDHDANRDTQ